MKRWEEISTDSPLDMEHSSEEIDNYGYLSPQDMCIDCDKVPPLVVENPPDEKKQGEFRIMTLSFSLLLVYWLTR
jgi:hypothetical protein